MFGFKSLDSQLQEEVDQLIKENSTLHERIVELERAWPKINAYNQAREATVVIDYDSLNPFSIERNASTDGISYTTFGHWDNTTQTSREWTVYCTEAIHERLASEFVAWINRQKDHSTD